MAEKDPEIQFKPLTDGLGFHPFADGLPYAPTSKSQTPTTGTGAVAAGRPQFVTQRAAPIAIHPTPVAPAIERIRKELEILSKEKISEPTFSRVPPAPVKTYSPQITVRYGIGYSLQRFFAYFIDSAFNLSICAAVLSTALLSADLESFALYNPQAIAIAGLFLFLCNWSLIAAQEVAFGTSLGKKIFGLKLNGTGTEVFVRAILFIPSLVFSGLGLWIAIFDSRKRCWHDRATQIQPEET